jgi:hypothetical protein
VGDEVQLGFEEAQVEGTAQAAKMIFVEVGCGLFLAGAPQHADDTSEITEESSPIHFTSGLFFNGGQHSRLGRDSIPGLHVRIVHSHGFFVETKCFEKFPDLI